MIIWDIKMENSSVIKIQQSETSEDPLMGKCGMGLWIDEYGEVKQWK